jgi:hypothetical protein
MAVIGAGCLAGAARAGEAYYMLIFGSQRPVVNRPKYSHTFATFVRYIDGCGGSPGPQVEAFTLSWLPVKGELTITTLRPECGRNYDLHSTIRLVMSQGQRVSVWGPYQVHRVLYERAYCQKCRLDSGTMQYKTVDVGYPGECVSNCIHSIIGVSPDAPNLHIGPPGWGETASYFATLSMRPWIIDPSRTHDWLLGQLGLCGYPLVRRDLNHNPAGSAVLRALQSIHHLNCR